MSINQGYLLGASPCPSKIIEDNFLSRGNTAIDETDFLAVNKINVHKAIDSSAGWIDQMKWDLQCVNVFGDLQSFASLG